MSLIVWWYNWLSVISVWVEKQRTALLIRAYGIDKNEKPPVPWRKREGLPDSGHWPKGGWSENVRYPHSTWLTGKQKVGPVRPVPAELAADAYVPIEMPATAEEANARLREHLKRGSK